MCDNGVQQELEGIHSNTISVTTNFLWMSASGSLFWAFVQQFPGVTKQSLPSLYFHIHDFTEVMDKN